MGERRQERGDRRGPSHPELRGTRNLPALAYFGASLAITGQTEEADPPPRVPLLRNILNMEAE